MAKPLRKITIAEILELPPRAELISNQDQDWAGMRDIARTQIGYMDNLLGMIERCIDDPKEALTHLTPRRLRRIAMFAHMAAVEAVVRADDEVDDET